MSPTALETFDPLQSVLPEQHVMDVEVTCFGSLTLRVGARRVEKWRPGKSRALFQYLVLNRRRPVSRESLIDALWPDPDALAAGTSLKVAVHALRQTLRDAESGDALTVTVHDSSYALYGPSTWIDVEEFERLCALGHRFEAAQPEVARALFARAADLYRGDLLGDAWDDWVLVRREALKDQYLLILSRLADAALERSDYATCIDRCRQILDQDCCREDAYRTLMLCHARLGQPARVLRWYELCAYVLRTRLDVEPDPATVRLRDSALSGRGATAHAP